MASEPATSASTSTQAQRPAPPQQKPSSQPKVDVSIESSSHLDPGAYVRGTLPIKIGHAVLVHPRVYLLSIHSPLIIGDGCIISEKAILGGPAPATGSGVPATTEQAHISKSSGGEESNPTVIESFVQVHPNALINHGAVIKSSAVVEANSVIDSNVTVGAHSKISAGLTITSDVPEWTVVWGSDGDQRQKRRRARHQDVGENVCELIERERLKAMEKERDGTIAILKAAAARTLVAAGARKK